MNWKRVGESALVAGSIAASVIGTCGLIWLASARDGQQLRCSQSLSVAITHNADGTKTVRCIHQQPKVEVVR